MSWISDLLGGSFGGVVDKFHTSGQEEQEFKLEMQRLLRQCDAEIEQSLRRELEALVLLLVDPARVFVRPLTPPEEFMWGWTGIVGTYAVGRSVEKSGAGNLVIRIITGSRAPQSSLLDNTLQG